MRWLKPDGTAHEIAYLWGEREGEVVEGCLPFDARTLDQPGKLMLVALHRSSALIRNGTLVDHVVLHATRR